MYAFAISLTYHAVLGSFDQATGCMFQGVTSKNSNASLRKLHVCPMSICLQHLQKCWQLLSPISVCNKQHATEDGYVYEQQTQTKDLNALHNR